MDLATVQDWTKSTREHFTASDHLDAIDALIKLLNGSESPSATAATITKAYSNYVEQPMKNSDSDRVQRFWGIFCDAARTFGSAHSRLIDLLHEISTEPDTQATDGSSTIDPNGRIYWRDLPGLPFALCDDALRSFVLLQCKSALANNSMLDYHHPYDHSPEEMVEFLDQAPYLLNGTVFTATLFERGFDVPGLNLSAQADHFLEDGIESSHNDEHVIKSQEWKVLIPASASRIMIAGKTIYKMCLDDQDASQNFHSKRPWNKARWELWKEQLRKFENRDDFDDECRGYASRALAKMVHVEEAPQV